MYKATKLLSSSSYPTMGDVRLAFIGMFTALDNCLNADLQQSMIASSISIKLDEYWSLFLDRSSSLSAFLDPRTKSTTFITNNTTNEMIQELQNIISIYSRQENVVATNIQKKSNAARNYFYSIVHQNITTSTTQSEDGELDKYLRTPVELDIEPLVWWRVHETEYPILSRIARDYLVIQSTSVPAEEAFSIAGLTINKLRNKLLPDTARAIICLKNWISEGIGIHKKNG
jgi:hypothetical protein